MIPIMSKKGFKDFGSKEMRAEFATRDWANRNKGRLAKAVGFWMIVGAVFSVTGYILSEMFLMGIGLVFLLNAIAFPFIFRMNDDPLLKLAINMMLFNFHLKFYLIGEVEKGTFHR
ncbi:hypothetical protein [Vibrio crassostreae]|uniref:hypothetical protein n=1 Tax=Vibrio crassostreae TaxID=246167 RepID=UPI001B30DB42|nr:hypothetical protein [Vibrio crassostreae]